MSIKKKAAIAVGVLLILAIGIGLIAANATSDDRAMKQALKTGDAGSVIQVYRELSAKGKSTKAGTILADYIKDAEKKINSDFTCKIDQKLEYGAAQRLVSTAMAEYLKQHWGALLSENGRDKLYLSMDDILVENALDSLQDMIYSKQAYYTGQALMKHAESYTDYQTVIELFQDVEPSDKKYKDALDQAQTASQSYLEAVLKLVDTYLEQGDHAGAINLMESAVKADFLTDTTQLSQKLDQVRAQSAEKYADKAREALAAGDAEGAIGNMEVAVSLNPSGDYQAKLEEYKLYRPFALYDEDNILKVDEQKGEVYHEDSMTANDNTAFSNVLRLEIDRVDGVNENIVNLTYNLRGGYDKLTGVIFVPQSEKSKKQAGYFEVYGDGMLLYTSPTVSPGVLPQQVECSVTGVQTLELRFYHSADTWPRNCYYGIADLIVQKTVPAS